MDAAAFAAGAGVFGPAAKSVVDTAAIFALLGGNAEPLCQSQLGAMAARGVSALNTPQRRRDSLREATTAEIAAHVAAHPNESATEREAYLRSAIATFIVQMAQLK